MRAVAASSPVDASRPSPLVQLLCAFGALLLISVPIALAFTESGLDPLGLAFFLGVPDPLPFGPVRWRALAVSLLYVGCGLYVLAQLWRLFARYRRGDALSAGTARVFRAFAWGVVALAMVQIGSAALMSVAVSWDNAPGQRYLRVTIEWKDYLLLLLGAVLVAVARVMVRAADVEAENRSFV